MATSCCLPLLPRNWKRSFEPVHLDVAVAHGGEPERAVLARVLLVADADVRRVEEPDDGGEHALAAQVGPAQVAVDARADPRQHLAEGDGALVLGGVACLAPALVVAVLLAPASVAAGGLDVAVGDRADPDVGPRRRHRDVGDALDLRRLPDRPAVDADVPEPAAAAGLAPDPGRRRR